MPNAVAHDDGGDGRSSSLSVVAETIPLPPQKPAAVVHVGWMTILCYGGMVCLAAGMVHYPIILTAVVSDFHLDAEQAGKAGSLIYDGTILAVLLFTPVANHAGVKTAMLLACLSCALACAGEFFSPSYPILCCALFFQGLGCGALDLLLSPIVASMHRDSVTTALSYLHSFYSTGAVASTLLATGIVSVTDGGWRWVPGVILVIPTILALAFSRELFPVIVSEDEDNGVVVTSEEEDGAGATPIEATKPSTSSSEMTLVELFTSPTFWLCIVMMILSGASEQGPVIWLPAYTEEGLGFSSSLSGLSLTVFSVWMSAGRLLGGRFGELWNPFKIMLSGSVLQIICVHAAVLLPAYPIAAYGFATLIGYAIAMLWPTVLAISALEHPKGGTKMFGILTIAGGLGASFMSWVVGAIKDKTGSIRIAFWSSSLAGVCLAVTAGMAWYVHYKHEQKMAQQAKTKTMKKDTSPMVHAAAVVPANRCFESPRHGEAGDFLP